MKNQNNQVQQKTNQLKITMMTLPKSSKEMDKLKNRMSLMNIL